MSNKQKLKQKFRWILDGDLDILESLEESYVLAQTQTATQIFEAIPCSLGGHNLECINSEIIKEDWCKRCQEKAKHLGEEKEDG